MCQRLMSSCIKGGFILCIFIALYFLACLQNGQSPEGQRAEMVRVQLEQRGIRDTSILRAFQSVPREEFVLPRFRDRAYDDLEVPIGEGQTLDRPYEDALMMGALSLKDGDRVLEVGTGTGYLSALMSTIAAKVYTIEIDPTLAGIAKERLARLGYKNVHVKTGDGFLGWPGHAPFDAIILACSPPELPGPLKEQLAEGGRMLLPLGGSEKYQELVLYTKKNGKIEEVKRLAPATFTPMKGKVLEGR